MLTGADFARLGFWEDVTPEENITVYGMDFAGTYLLLTDAMGRTPVKEKDYLVAAAYDEATDAFLWGVELKNFAALTALCAAFPAGSAELLEALRTYTLAGK